MGYGSHGRHSLKRAVEKQDIAEHYNNVMMPMLLRMVAEEIEGSNLTGQPAGAGLRDALDVVNDADNQGGMFATLDISRIFQ